MSGVVDVNLETVFRVMDMYNIPKQEWRQMSERVRSLSRHMIDLAHEESERQREEDKLMGQHG